MKDSLKQKLVDLIKMKGSITHREMVIFCMDHNYKPYTGTRRLQEVRNPEDPSYDPEIGVIEEDGTIKAYVHNPSETQNSAPGRDFTSKAESTGVCCESWLIFQIHERACQKATAPAKPTLF